MTSIAPQSPWRMFFLNGHAADAFYVVPHHIPDPFFFLTDGATRYVFLDAREFGVIATMNLPGITLVPLEPFMDEALQGDLNVPRENRIAVAIMKKYGIVSLRAHINTPLDMVEHLQKSGVAVQSAAPFFPERKVKTAQEVAYIEAVFEHTREAYRLVERLLREARIEQDGSLSCQGAPLTSELVKKEIGRYFFEHGLTSPEGIIISGGPHAAIPHHRGGGALHSNETIICDIFPHDTETGYFSDMTRTYLKGTPTEKQKQMYDAVRTVQEEVLALIKPGVTGAELYMHCINRFSELGFPTGEEGFIHGVGHSFGLDIHERPYLSKGDLEPLQPGHVVTVEPGLYYKSLGGVRIEDVVVVTKNGCRNLTNYPKEFVIA